MPVERTASRLIHRTATARTLEGDRGILARCHIAYSFFRDHIALHNRLQLCSGWMDEWIFASTSHHAPHSTDLTESNSNFTKVFTARIPMVIGYRKRATTPAASATSIFAVMRQLMQQDTARLVCPCITGIISKV